MVFVPIETALAALHQVFLSAPYCKMADFIALEADLSITTERVMAVSSTQNARCTLGLVWTVTTAVAILSAVFALGGRVALVSEVSPLLFDKFIIL